MAEKQDRHRGRCLSVAPGMPSRDMDRTADHYRRLGFEIFRLGDGFLIAERDDIAFHIALKSGHDPATTATWVWMSVDDPDATYEEWRSAGWIGSVSRCSPTTGPTRAATSIPTAT